VPGTWYIQRGRSDPLGPFTTDEIVEGLTHGEIPSDSLVREIAGTAWLPFAAVEDFRDALSMLRPASPVAQDETQLAPKPGPAWKSAADRHVVRGAPADAPAPVEGARPAKRRSAPAIDARPEPLPLGSATVAAMIGALGVIWGFVRLGAWLSPPQGWIPIIDRFHMVRDASIADLALAATTYPLLFVGVVGARARAPFGIPLVRAVARVLCVGNLVIIGVTLARLQRSPRFAEVASSTSLIAIVAGAPLLLAACAVSLFWIVPAREPEVEGPSETLYSAGIGAAFIGAAVALFHFDVDAVVAGGRGDAFAYTDTLGLRLYAEGLREGVAGTFKIDGSRARGFALGGPTRARFVQDFTIALEGGGTRIGREVELLEGPRTGSHVYLLPEDAPVLASPPAL
jgi:hypothetical protein